MSIISQLAVIMFVAFLVWWAIDWTLGKDKVPALARWIETNIGEIGVLAVIVSLVFEFAISLCYVGSLIRTQRGGTVDSTLLVLTDTLSILMFAVIGVLGLFSILRQIRLHRIG